MNLFKKYVVYTLFLIANLYTTLLLAAEKTTKSEGKSTETISDITEMSLEKFWSVVHEIWNFEIFSVSGRSIRISNIIIALLFLIVGIVISSLIGRLLRKLMIKRFHLTEGPAHSIQSLSFYLLLVGFVLFAMNIANIPLTIFTIAGGAIAIGVGFGSQNIMNNFISGIILLIERPIRAGDIINLEGTYGTIQSIGTRSTKIRTFDNIDIIVPNSSFLEKNVVNWTLGDDIVRTVVSVGVVYGSPTEKVRDIILQVVKEHPDIRKSPEPFVLFTEFADSSLNFEVYFWVRIKTIFSIKKVQSDIRYRIDSLFRENKIVIAFPQRDVHLDTTKPIDVRLTGK